MKAFNLQCRTVLASILLTLGGCGGGGSSSTVDPPALTPTPIPSTLAITAPATADVSSPVLFTQTAGAAADFRYSWDFGDGGTSTASSPSHSYAKGGDYVVSLRLSNGAGATRDLTLSVSVNNQTLMRGLNCSGSQEAGWCWQRPRLTGSGLSSSFFIDSQTGWQTAANGELYKTTNGGASWTRKNLGVDFWLGQVTFVDDKLGYILADTGRFLRTVDGGESWTAGQFPEGRSLELFYRDTQNLIVQDWQWAWSSTDRGATWQGPWRPFNAIGEDKTLWSLRDGQLYRSEDLGRTEANVLDARFANAFGERSSLNAEFHVQPLKGAGVVALATKTTYEDGRFNYRRQGWRSDDSGKTWQSFIPQGLPDAPTSAVASTPANTLFYTAYDSWYRSPDGGAPWLKTSICPGSFSRQIFRLSDQILISDCGGDAAFQVSYDDGLNWTKGSPLESNAGLIASARMLDAQNLFVGSGANGYVSADQGKTWAQVAGLTQDETLNTLLAFWALDAKRAFSVTAGNELRFSADGGRSWQTRVSKLPLWYQPYPYVPPKASLQFISDKAGWMSLGAGLVYRTTDGGETWNPMPVRNTTMSNFQFVDDTQGWAVADTNRLMRTQDSGQSWSEAGTLPAGAIGVHFSDGQRGFALGGGLWQTLDGGKTWMQRLSAGWITVVRHVDATTVIAAGTGPNIYRSSDGGATWTSYVSSSTDSSWSALHFLDAKRGWLGGRGGAVYATADGGLTWQKQVSGMARQAVTHLQFVDPKTGWLLGDFGGLMATGTGGN